ncbi:major facilitator superfamily domain-containing protein [Achaetomium macrosporum]|uniref:Major facilitator superfamily domain-containing protein n=1 Tax=Achaetomium macrosporum TaxID=79813 RepID=A0AAN7HB43_9PEZI|nr:major facilitator superfamily domain-containing protein [Achaetomium macrosporum]
MSSPAIELDSHIPVGPAQAPRVTAIEETNGQDSNNAHSHTLNEFSLPPVDSGKDAWLFLAGCWAVEALVWALTHEKQGVMYIATPFVIALCRLRPRWARWSTLAGLVAASLSMAASSFCTTVDQLIATQGVLFGIGGCFAYCPSILYIDEWFARRKGMAYGIMWSAAGFGGVVLPLLLEFLLTAYGFRTALRVWAVVLFLLSLPLSFVVKPRLPLSAAAARRFHFNMRYVLSRRFLLHQLANVVQATGYFLPGVYLPSYARAAFGVSTMLSALTVLLVNVAATMGSVIMGWMTDKLPVTTCLVFSGIGASLAVLLLWGLTSTLAGVYAFCIAYGLFAGCYTSIWPGIMREIATPRNSEEHTTHAYVDPSLVFGWLCAGRGIGNVVSGPLSDLLIHRRPWLGQAMGGYGSGYGSLIVYTGVSAVVGGSAFVWRRLGML